MIIHTLVIIKILLYINVFILNQCYNVAASVSCVGRTERGSLVSSPPGSTS